MLNEKREFDLYLTQGYGGSLRTDNLADSLKGIRRVLTVLARGLLDICRENGIAEKDRLDQYATAFLKTWLLGTQDEENPLPSVLRPYFQRASEACLLQYLEDKAIGKSKAYLTDRVESWSKPLFGKTDDPARHSLNEIRFKSILADAMLQGPLKNEILVLRHSRFHFDLQGNFNYRHKEQLLSIVALYLQRKPDDCSSVPIVLADLSNYMNKPCNKGNQNIFKSVATLIDKAGYTYKGRPLFFKECLADSCTKLSVDAQWLIDWDVHLAPAEIAVRSGYVWYDDDLLRRS